jgi:ferrochelatase
MTEAVLLASHGSVDDLADLAAFVTNVRRGRPPDAALLTELRRRYEAIGGSPLNAINGKVAGKLARRLGVRVERANRLWRPYVRDVVAQLASEGVTRVVLLPLAQHSAAVYAADARPAAEAAGVELACVDNWGQNGDLCRAFAARIVAVLGGDGTERPTTVVMTAHSLPVAVTASGDPYAREVADAASTIFNLVHAALPGRAHLSVAFQSQGMAGSGGPIQWMGPDLPTALGDVAARGDTRVVFAPVGFLADHVEILYDLDVEARALAEAKGLAYARAASLNADDDFIDVLAAVARPMLRGAPS